MSQLLMVWLNDEVQLSKKVTSFENDFSNGYLFGELLSKFNQQLNFEEFSNKDVREAKMKNFQLLEPTFKTLHISFNFQLADQVIKCKKGVAMQLLYQLQMQLQKVNDPHDIMMHAKTGKYNVIQSLMIIRQPKEQFDKMEQDFFIQKLNERNKAQKDVNLERSLGKFTTFAIQQAEKERRLKIKEEIEERNLKEEMRKIQLNKLQRNMAFMEDWNQKGIDNWKKNQQIRYKNKLNDDKFKSTMQKIAEDRLVQTQQFLKSEMEQQIEIFENRQKDESQSLGLRNKMMNEFMRKERDKRRRKMIVDQEKQTNELQRREYCVVEKLQQQSRQEKEIMYEIWRSFQCKEVICENRILRDENYKNKKELNVINQKFKEEEMLRSLQQEFNEEIELQQKRQLEINVEYKLLIRQQNYEKCRKLVEILFEIEEQVYEHLQNSDSNQINQQFTRENNHLFEQGMDLIPYKRFRTYDPIKEMKLQETQNYQQKMFLAKMEMQDYLEGNGAWNIYQAQNNYTLGNLVRYLIESQFEITNPEQIELNIPYVPFRGSVIGFAFSGKSTICELLSKKYGITLLYVDVIINELLEYISKYQQGEEHSQIWDQQQIELGQSISNYLLEGENIPDELYIKAIVQKIKRTFEQQTFEQIYEEQKDKCQNHNVRIIKSIEDFNDDGINWEDFHRNNMINNKPYCKGWLLVGFPHTYDQAKLLEKYLTNIQPQDEPTALQTRLEEAARIVKPNEYHKIPRTKQESGVGICMYLEMPSNEMCLRRAIGRRFDNHNNSLYHLDSNHPPIDNAPLIERIKPLYEVGNLQQQISDKNSYFMTQIGGLKNWYDNFESKCESNIQKAFITVDSSNNYEKVFYDVDQVFQNFLQIQINQIQQKQESQQNKILEEEKLIKQKQEQEELDQKCQIKQVQLDKLPQKQPSQAFLKYLNGYWNLIENKYILLQNIFKGFREQREFITNYQMDIQRKFIDLINTPDEKFYFIRNYQEQYNEFIFENPDLCEEDVCKEELHQRVDDVYDQLIDIIDQKRDDLIVEKSQIQTSQFIENEIELYLLQLKTMLVIELDRTTNSIQLLNDYYSTLEGIELSEIQPAVGELQLIDGDDPQIRLDKLIADTLRIFAGEEEIIEDKNKKGAKQPAKKEEKKGKKGKEEEVIKKELQNSEAINAIDLEKQIFKERVDVIKRFATQTILKYKQAVDLLYSKLDEWIHYTHLTEIKALDAISNLFRGYIERGERIQKELQLQFVDVIISHEVLNFLTPIPPPLTAREPLSKERFSISQLYYLIEDLKAITNTHLFIDIKQLALLLSRSSYDVLKLTPAQWMRALKVLDENGYVNVRQICTYLILLQSPIPKEEELQIYQTQLNGLLVDKENFVNTPAWFDDFEKVPEEENTNYFDRIIYIKELLFFIHKDENDQLATKQYLDILNIKGDRYIDFLLQNLQEL
ncbi:unnamed protein product [Paramecium primaurelia]|uniref:Calponin-homology (CH) domain-containing protein n=1 Tax=Paramecium primaurelia TaxID=5886 RepID=A0A8S1MWA7_PARPR|nr:unnamed protein product [Paramecium primaurelia]